jgi:N-acyl-D-aspartate/D-glutamate deacylase
VSSTQRSTEIRPSTTPWYASARRVSTPGKPPGICEKSCQAWASGTQPRRRSVVVNGQWSVERWVELTATEPARLFGLGDRKGRLRPGMDADVVVFDPGASKRLDAGALHMRTDHSPYADVTVTGWPAVTISRGQVVALDGEPARIEPGRGRYLRRLPRGTPSPSA